MRALLTVLLLGPALAPPAPAQAAAQPPEAASAAQEPGDPLAEARRLWEEGRRREAVDVLVQAASAGPSDRERALLLAGYRVELQQYRAALEALGAPEAGEDGRARHLRGACHYFLGEYDASLVHLRPSERDDVLMVHAAQVALGDHAGADRTLSEHVRPLLGADDPRVLVLEGQRLARTGRDADAREPFERALAADEWNAEALFGLGRALLRLGERERAMELLQRHRELVPLLDELEHAQRGVALDPLHAPGHAAVGDVRRKMGDREGALRAYARAYSLARDDQVVPVALRYARLLAEDLGRPDEAVALLDAGAERVGDPRLAVRAADVLLAAGRPREALARYEAVLRARPNDAALLERVERARAAAAKEPR